MSLSSQVRILNGLWGIVGRAGAEKQRASRQRPGRGGRAGMELLRSNKGNNLLVVNGFTYNEHSRSKNGRKIYWCCSERASCNARVHTNTDFGDLQLLQDGTNKHLGHIEDRRGVETRRVMQGVKRKAKENPNEAPTKLIRQAVAPLNDPEVLAWVPARNSVRRVVNQHQNLGRPRNPQELQDIILDSPFTTTKRGTRFLLFDSGPGDPDRVVVFAAEKSLKVLLVSEIVFSDGTFKTVPNQFGQLTTVHDPRPGRGRGVATNEATYRPFWEATTEEATRPGKRFRIRIMMTDFELPAINVQRAMFPDVQHKGCLFHFNQSLWRQYTEGSAKKAKCKNCGTVFTYCNSTSSLAKHLRDIHKVDLELNRPKSSKRPRTNSDNVETAENEDDIIFESQPSSSATQVLRIKLPPRAPDLGIQRRNKIKTKTLPKTPQNVQTTLKWGYLRNHWSNSGNINHFGVLLMPTSNTDKVKEC
ncbi:hypothetical protein FOCC_FOCC014235, partial [Frankliniella occidentalis]